MLQWLHATLLTLLVLPIPSWACGRAELLALVESAQKLADDTSARGTKLLRCLDEAPQAAFWLTFYLDVKKPTPNTARPRAVTTRAPVPGPVGQQIVQAYQGSFSTLKTEIDAGNPTYKDVPATSLAIARMSALGRRYAEARRYYELYFRLQDAAPEVDAEYLYTFIWEGSLDRAESELRKAQVDAPTELTSAIARGQDLVAVLRGQTPKSQSNKPPRAKTKPIAQMGAESYAVFDQMLRLSSILAYDDVVTARWSHHLVKVNLYGGNALNTDELWLGRNQALGAYFRVAAHAGYVLHAASHWAGRAELEVGPEDGFKFKVGGSRDFLYKTLPLAKPSLEVYQDSGFANLAYAERVHLRYGLARDSDGPAYANGEAGFSIPLLQPDTQQGIDLILGKVALGYELRQRPSIHYQTYRQTQSLHLGALWTRGLTMDYSFRGDLMYRLLVRKPFGDDTYLRHSGAQLLVGVDKGLGESLSLGAHAMYDVQESDQPRNAAEQKASILVNLQVIPQ